QGADRAVPLEPLVVHRSEKGRVQAHIHGGVGSGGVDVGQHLGQRVDGPALGGRGRAAPGQGGYAGVDLVDQRLVVQAAPTLDVDEARLGVDALGQHVAEPDVVAADGERHDL